MFFSKIYISTYIHNAVNGIPKELANRHNGTAGKDEESRDLAMQAKHRVVDPYLEKNQTLVINTKPPPRDFSPLET